MNNRLKIGLIGAGVFAGYHANKLAAHPRVDFIGVSDPDRERAEVLAHKHDVMVLSKSDLLEAAEAVIIASPAIFHGGTTIAALQAGCHCLVEKPLAVTVEAAVEIETLSKRLGLTVQVGHQERMVLQTIGLDVVSERPIKVRARRVAPYSLRGTDTSVTMDLMTHDIDLCTLLFGRAPDRVEGKIACVRSASSDESHATLYYGDAIAELVASRIAEASQRQMTITYPSGDVSVDFNTKTLVHSTAFALNEKFGEEETVKDSLGAATDMFVRAILDNAPILVSAEDGTIAVHAAVEIDKGSQ